MDSPFGTLAVDADKHVLEQLDLPRALVELRAMGGADARPNSAVVQILNCVQNLDLDGVVHDPVASLKLSSGNVNRSGGLVLATKLEHDISLNRVHYTPCKFCEVYDLISAKKENPCRTLFFT
jgi:hypothetical protein